MLSSYLKHFFFNDIFRRGYQRFGLWECHHRRGDCGITRSLLHQPVCVWSSLSLIGVLYYTILLYYYNHKTKTRTWKFSPKLKIEFQTNKHCYDIQPSLWLQLTPERHQWKEHTLDRAIILQRVKCLISNLLKRDISLITLSIVDSCIDILKVWIEAIAEDSV